MEGGILKPYFPEACWV